MRVYTRVTGRPGGLSEALAEGAARVAAALGCQAVYGFLLGRDGKLRCRAVAPSGLPTPGVLSRDASPALFDALYDDVPAVLDAVGCAGIVPRLSGAQPVCCAGPLMAPSGPLGVLLAVLDRVPQPVELESIGIMGRATAYALEAVQTNEVLARRARACEQTMQRMLSAVLASDTPGFVLDLDGRVVRWGSGAASRFGWREQDVRGRSLPTGGDEGLVRLTAEIREGAASEAVFPLSLEILHASGTLERLEAFAVSVATGEESVSGVVVVCRHGELGLHERASLRQAYLAALVERELTSPLTAVKGYAQLLARPSIAEDAQQRDRIARGLLQRAAEVERLLEDLALLSGLEQGRGLVAEPVDVHDIVAHAVQAVNAERGGPLFVVERSDAAGKVLIDRTCAERSLAGLLRSIARTIDDGATVRLAVTLRENSVVVAVEAPNWDAAREEALAPLASIGSGQALTEAGIGFHLARLAAEAHGGAVVLEPGTDGVPRLEIALPLHEGPEEVAWLTRMV